MSQAHRRLMDLLAGWEQYVDKCADHDAVAPAVTGAEYLAEGEEIRAIYQRVGQHNELTAEETREVFLDIMHILTDGTRRLTRPFEAWASHRYMTVNTCLGQFATREEAQACIDEKLRETRDIDVWVYPWIKDRRVTPDGSKADE